jgi:acyl carrier protein
MTSAAFAIQASPTTSQGAVFQAMERFFAETLPAAAVGNLSEDLQLLDSGLLDSLSMLQLTTFLSDEFAISFEDEDFTAENFATAGSVAALVASKITSGA